VLAFGFGALFTLAMWIGGETLYASMGARDASLAMALAYSNVLFLGSVPVWLVALLGAALRGAGEVHVPARITLIGAIALLAASPALIFGVGPLPRLEMVGAGLALVLYFTFAALFLVRYMRSAQSRLRLARHRLEWRHFGEILGVGSLSAVGT